MATFYYKIPEIGGGSGSDTNFATDDLTFTQDTNHDLAGFNVTLSEVLTGTGTKPSMEINTAKNLNNQTAPVIKLEADMPNNGTIQDALAFEWNNGGVLSGHGVALVTKGETSQQKDVGARIFWDNSRTITTDYFLQGINHNTQNFTISSSGNFGVGIGVAPSSAKLQVKGTGSSDATTALLVQNSSSTNLSEIKDDGTGTINATGRVIRLFKSTAFNPYMEINSSVGDNCSFVFSQGANSKYSIGFENFTGDFRIFDIAAGVNRLSVTNTGKINLFAPSTTTENFNVKGTGLFEINDNNPLTVRTTNNANMFLAIDSASTSWNSQVQFQQGMAAKWNIGCKGTTQSFWFFNHATSNTPLEIDSSDNIIMANLPTSSAGLPTGALWNNSGVINIA